MSSGVLASDDNDDLILLDIFHVVCSLEFVMNGRKRPLEKLLRATALGQHDRLPRGKRRFCIHKFRSEHMIPDVSAGTPTLLAHSMWTSNNGNRGSILSLNDHHVWKTLDWSIGPLPTRKQYVGLLRFTIFIDRRQLRRVTDCVHKTVLRSSEEILMETRIPSLFCEGNESRCTQTPLF